MDRIWMCDWEKLMIKTGLFKLVHDGQHNPGQFELPPEEVRFYTKTYQMILSEGPVHTWVKFKYDLREGEVSVDLTWHEPKEKTRHEEMAMTNVKEVVKSG